MHGRPGDLAEIEAVARAAGAFFSSKVFVCPPAVLLRDAVRVSGESGLGVGAQDCSPHPDGAHTGDHSAGMLAAHGAQLVIVGHSERRSSHGETDEMVKAKAEAALAAGLLPLVCVGETAQARVDGAALEVVTSQACASAPCQRSGWALAYEPMWAIGAGRTPGPEEIAAVHAALRERLAAKGSAPQAILYGGSVKPDNARQLLAVPGVEGLLVGGCSLSGSQFLQIVRAWQERISLGAELGEGSTAPIGRRMAEPHL